VVVERFTPREAELAGRRYVFAQGMLANHGPGPAADIHVVLTVRRTTDGETLKGGGTSWLDVLDAGESGPFSVPIAHCCAAELADYTFTLFSTRAPGPRYRDLAVEAPVERDVDGARWIYGDLANSGDAFLNAPTTRLFMGFWAGDDLLEIETARLPVVFDVADPVGQSHPPGWRYPWAVHVPDVSFDRTTTWTYAESYPSGVYPIPLGVEGIAAARDGPDVRVEATLTHCGTGAVENVVVVVVARDAIGRVVEFGRAQPELAAPLPPGGRAPLVLIWPNARAEIDPARVTLWPLALETQAIRPIDIPCRPQAPQGYLPWLARNADR